ncbi:MAG: hypothetical protein ABIO16_08940 [Nocardioides sp.]
MTVSPEPEGPAGYSYAAVALRTTGSAPVLDLLREIGFSGWVAPPENGWLLLLPAAADSAVATGRRGVVEVAAAFADRVPTALALRVLDDRQLALVCWQDGIEVARYVSDPSREPGAAWDVADDPLGVEQAEAIAEACGRPEAGEELAEVLAEAQDPAEEIESERLRKVLELLGLPTWPVSAWVLPKRMPLGPSPSDLTRLGAGRPGVGGLVAGTVAKSVRRRRPAPVIADPPRRDAPPDDLMWL